MKSLVCIKPGVLEYQDIPKPGFKSQRAIIKVKSIGICGTDIHAFEGVQPYFSYPRILGHELSGELVEIDGNSDFKIGERVTVIPYFNCNHCIACRRGRPNCCSNIEVFGVHIDGGMKEFISVPSDKLVHGDNLSYEELCLIEPLAIGAHGVARAHIKPGDFVVVIGAGPIGLAVMEFARIAGGQVIALDVNAGRLIFCREVMGIDFVINALQENALEKIIKITDGDRAVCVFDATGNLNAINAGLDYVANSGSYILVGLQGKPFSFSHPEFHKREATLMSSRNATSADFEYVTNSIKNKQIDPLKFITNRFPFDQIKEQFAKFLNPENGVIKAVITIP